MVVSNRRILDWVTELVRYVIETLTIQKLAGESLAGVVESVRPKYPHEETSVGFKVREGTYLTPR